MLGAATALMLQASILDEFIFGNVLGSVLGSSLRALLRGIQLAQLAQLEGNFSYFARGGASQINWLGVARG